MIHYAHYSFHASHSSWTLYVYPGIKEEIAIAYFFKHSGDFGPPAVFNQRESMDHFFTAYSFYRTIHFPFCHEKN